MPEKKFLLPQAAIILRPQNICPFLSTHVSKNAFNEILFMNLFIFVLNWLRGATNVCFKWYYCEDSINVILCVYILYWQFYFKDIIWNKLPPEIQILYRLCINIYFIVLSLSCILQSVKIKSSWQHWKKENIFTKNSWTLKKYTLTQNNSYIPQNFHLLYCYLVLKVKIIQPGPKNVATINS